MLTVKKVYDSGKRRKGKNGVQARIVYWVECLCDCGKIKHGERATITRGQIESCGCKYGFYFLSRKHKSEFFMWMNIKARCYKKNHPEYKNYGKRGIKMCDEWLNSFERFFNYIGLRPSGKLSLDRIENDGNYEPGNVRWATDEVQNNNRRANKFIEFEGKKMTVPQWSKFKDIPKSAIYYRFTKGWTAQDIFSIPIKTR